MYIVRSKVWVAFSPMQLYKAVALHREGNDRGKQFSTKMPDGKSRVQAKTNQPKNSQNEH